MLDPQLRLEMLLDYANALPPLPERLHAQRDAGLGRVAECQSPVYLFTTVEDDTVRLFADVPEQAPTARGFVSLLVDALDGAHRPRWPPCRTTSSAGSASRRRSG